MANFMQGILNALKLTDEEDEFDDDERERGEFVTRAMREEEPARPPKRFADSSKFRDDTTQPRRISSYEEDDYEPPRRGFSSIDRQQPSSRITPIRSATQGLEVCIMKPKRFEDSQEVCDMLKNERAIILNLEGLEIALAQRIMDFISGSIYALDAKIHQISGYVFCISPERVDISGDYIDMVEQTGFEVPNLIRD